MPSTTKTVSLRAFSLHNPKNPRKIPPLEFLRAPSLKKKSLAPEHFCARGRVLFWGHGLHNPKNPRKIPPLEFLGGGFV